MNTAVVTAKRRGDQARAPPHWEDQRAEH